MKTMVLARGERMKIAGSNILSTSKRAGYIHAIGSWCGLIAEDIRGTGADFNTGAVKGWPLTDGFGDGIGDMVLHGVYAVIAASGTVVSTAGLALYGDVATNRADSDTANPLLGWLWPQDDGSLTRVVTADDPDWMQDDIDAGAGEVIVHVRLSGFPKTGLA